MATAAAQGSSSQPTAYAALDRTAPAGRLYYRLRQVDRDGTMTYSSLVTVAGSGPVAKVFTYPNPVRGSISFLAPTATSYRVLNQLGQALLSGIAGAGTSTVLLNSLTPGLYFLELQTDTLHIRQKFEKE